MTDSQWDAVRVTLPPSVDEAWFRTELERIARETVPPKTSYQIRLQRAETVERFIRDLPNLEYVVVVTPGIRARPDRNEAIAAFGIGHDSPGSGEIRIERGVVLVVDMNIAPRRIGLPYLQQHVRHRPAILVQHAA